MHRLSLSGREAPRPCTTTKALTGSYSLIHSFNNYAMGTIAGPFRRAPAPVPEPPQPPGAARRGPALSASLGRCRPHPSPARSGNPDPSLGLGRTGAPTPPRPASRGSRASAPIRRVRPAGFVERRSARPWRHPAQGSATLRARGARTRGPRRVGRDHRPLTSFGSDPRGLF